MRFVLMLWLVFCPAVLSGAEPEPDRVAVVRDWSVFVAPDDADGGQVCWAVTRAMPALPGGALGDGAGSGALLFLTVWPQPRGWVELSVDMAGVTDGMRARLSWPGPDLGEEVALLGRGRSLWLARDTQGRGTDMILRRWALLHGAAWVDLSWPGGIARFSLDGGLSALARARRACSLPVS